MGSIKEFIKNYHLVVDTSKSSDEILYIRSSIRSEKEVKSFMQKFEQNTCTIWRVHYGNYSPKRVVFRKAWVCRHSSNRNTDVEEKNCEAKLDILVKKINPSTIRNDTFLLKEPPLPCIICMRFKHNHSYEDDAKYLKIPDEVKELYCSYFDSGHGVAKALSLHEQHLKRNKTFSVTNFVPPNKVYYLHRQWQRRHNGLDTPENNVVDNDPWIIFNWDELINAIPRESPPVKIGKIKVSDSQSTNFSDEKNCESKDQVSLTNVVKMEKISSSIMPTSSCVKNECSAPETSSSVRPTSSCVRNESSAPKTSSSVISTSSCVKNESSAPETSSSVMPTSSCVKNENSGPETSSSIMPTSSCVENECSAPETIFLIRAPIPHQIAYSSNHMNGSVVTVMNSNCVASCSTLDSNPIASILTPISSLQSFRDTPSKPLVYFSDSNSSETTPNSEDTSNTLLDNLETVKSRSNYLHHSKVLDLSRNEITSTTSNNELKNEQWSSRSNKISQSYKNIITSKSSSQLSSTNHNGINLSQSNNQTLPTILNRKQKSKTCDILNSPAFSSFRSIKPKGSIHDASSVLDLFNSNGNCSVSSTSTEIHITNTVHQSGAQVSMKSSIPSTVNILQVPGLLENSTPPKEPIRIKEEPPDEDESNFSPTITKITSVDVNEKVKPEPSIKIRRTAGNITESSSSKDFSDDSATTSQVSAEEVEDEDQRFLMSLLRELKELPGPRKNKLKREMQSLVSSAINKENCRKRRKL